LHRHAPGENVLKGLAPDRPATDQQRQHAHDTDSRQRLPGPEPYDNGGYRNDRNADRFDPAESVGMVMCVPRFFMVIHVLRGFGVWRMLCCAHSRAYLKYEWTTSMSSAAPCERAESGRLAG